jgi:hypothetical protein
VARPRLPSTRPPIDGWATAVSARCHAREQGVATALPSPPIAFRRVRLAPVTLKRRISDATRPSASARRETVPR